MRIILLLGLIVFAIAFFAMQRQGPDNDAAPPAALPASADTPSQANQPPSTESANAASLPDLSADLLPFVTDADQFIDVDGARLRVRSEGPTDAPVIMMLHGFTFSLETWDAFAEALAGDYRVVRYDLLGHGLSGPDAQRRYSPTERAAFLGTVMDALDIQEATLVGNSLGSLVAWRFASNAPERVRQLVLTAPVAYSINGVGDTPAPIPPFLSAYLQNPTEPAVRFSLSTLYGNPSLITADRVALALAMLAAPGNGEAAIHHLEEFTLPDPTALLNAIDIPTVLVWGTRDSMVDAAHFNRILSAVPNAQPIISEGTGHLPQEEAADEILLKLRPLLK